MSVTIGKKTVQETFENYLRTITKYFEYHKESVNRLNVFPIPDGDTGTNMSLSLNSMLNAMVKLPSNATLRDVMKELQNSSLMGARGNSGTILAKWVEGLCQPIIDSKISLQKNPELPTEMVAAILESANLSARESVRTPVEGTILTVAEDIYREAAAHKSDPKQTVPNLMKIICEEALRSVERTPDLLPMLKENNVVDAGACGLAIILIGMADALGVKVDMPPELLLADKTGSRAAIEQLNDWDSGGGYRYCTEFLVHGSELDEERMWGDLSKLGDSVAIIGNSPLYKIHVHTNEPAVVLGMFMNEKHDISDVHINNMVIQVAERLASDANREPAEIGFVVVASGNGIKQLLSGLGHTIKFVDGGQSNNPSIGELKDAAERINARQVIILPNNKNVIMAAKEAAALCGKPAQVVETRSTIQAVSALAPLCLESKNLSEVASEMSELSEAVAFGAVATAIKNSRTASKSKVQRGDYITIIGDGDIDSAYPQSSDLATIATDLIGVLANDCTDTVTVLLGKDVVLEKDQIDMLKIYCDSMSHDLEIHSGGQNIYHLLIGVE